MNKKIIIVGIFLSLWSVITPFLITWLYANVMRISISKMLESMNKEEILSFILFEFIPPFVTFLFLSFYIFKYKNIPGVIRATIVASIIILTPHLLYYRYLNSEYVPGANIGIGLLLLFMPIYLPFFVKLALNWDKIWKKIRKKIGGIDVSILL
ncbi:MAG: hypothetical protein NC827_03115 [Candidatus Omnitrophica bacterium]|nr:hypothetical protein [Candidatus Omnitrophota bacterium]MCM8802283.1 hypothetical protein [Candidatus Omnitrophota bacterium]